MLNLIARALEQGADASARGLTGRHYLLGFVVLIVLIYLFLVVLAKFSKSVRGFLEFFGFRLSLGGRSQPPAPPGAVSPGVPTDTLLVTIQPSDTRWSEGMNDGKKCAIIVIHATVTNVYSRPVKLVKAILHPSGLEGRVGIPRANPSEFVGIDAFIPHEAMPCSMIWTVPRQVCPAAGNAFHGGVTIIDQYGIEQKHAGVTVPHDGATDLPR
jgi:hypothetical protein